MRRLAPVLAGAGVLSFYEALDASGWQSGYCSLRFPEQRGSPSHRNSLPVSARFVCRISWVRVSTVSGMRAFLLRSTVQISKTLWRRELSIVTWHPSALKYVSYVDFWGRDRDRTVERSPAFERLHQLPGLWVRDSLHRELEANGIEERYVGANRPGAVHDAFDIGLNCPERHVC
jgi:hypothetical protein